MPLRVSFVPPDLEITTVSVAARPPSVAAIRASSRAMPSGSVLSKKNGRSGSRGEPSASATNCGPSAEPPMPMTRRFVKRGAFSRRERARRGRPPRRLRSRASVASIASARLRRRARAPARAASSGRPSRFSSGLAIAPASSASIAAKAAGNAVARSGSRWSASSGSDVFERSTRSESDGTWRERA